MTSHLDIPSDGSPIFWGEISPCEHIAQIYDTDAVFLDTLAGFIGGGLIAGESTIVIATAPHLKALEQRLDRADVDVAQAIRRGQIHRYGR
jgi:MEDS: MEthanogen/methylotroph, DcmR Sensory domain